MAKLKVQHDSQQHLDIAKDGSHVTLEFIDEHGEKFNIEWEIDQFRATVPQINLALEEADKRNGVVDEDYVQRVVRSGNRLTEGGDIFTRFELEGGSKFTFLSSLAMSVKLRDDLVAILSENPINSPNE